MKLSNRLSLSICVMPLSGRDRHRHNLFTHEEIKSRSSCSAQAEFRGSSYMNDTCTCTCVYCLTDDSFDTETG